MAILDRKWDIVGVENPLIDLLVKVEDSFLSQHGLVKSHMQLIDAEEREMLLDGLRGHRVQHEPGGSCANTMLGVSQLGGRAVFCGKVGRDAFGKLFAERLKVGGVHPHMLVSKTPTGSTIILITPDAARTMNTYLGACQELTSRDVPVEIISEAKYLYLTAYLWDSTSSRAAAMTALKSARESQTEVVLNLADPFCIERHQTNLLELLQGGFVDVVMANRAEIHALLGKMTVEEAMRNLSQYVKTTVITLGSHGAYMTKGDEKVYIEALPVKAIDTTGAGDAFAAGFLYGETNQGTLEQCGQLGAAFAADIVQKLGPRLAQGDNLSHAITEAMRTFK